MTNKYDDLINAFEERLRLLMSEYVSLQDENVQLRDELKRKQDDLMTAHGQILEIRNNYESLRLARGFTGSDEEKEAAKKRIAGMVREIDKCIALLND